ncbi:glycosyltransferase [Pseudonocardia sp. KRD-184]|uniref:Glycosyltransferase n=1 Tax=Pseudonocardia oceani TaxID=2792013 RepID=A0ABS6U683_9PSEU|nr:glycosyltransferase [Pseudonocardia oceani]MBW0089579.1 glycosyltransferase [Pseudonocardia oceani]MBW0096505.1 glycosyltransferase [Pseudonocardia oceani]MBW0122753.1 glycosyltransferase [Pseudonocardia oceani]MBW0127481.1 glycosyltransferase [Pseudonocardia oceani]
MKVLHVITGLAAGGAERYLRSLIAHSSADADVLALAALGVVAEELRAHGIRVDSIGMSGNRDVRALARIRRHIRDGNYDVVHTHLFRAQLYGSLAARAAKVPVVISTEHSLKEADFEGRSADNPLFRLIYQLAARQHDRMLAVSEDVANCLRRRVGGSVDIGVVPLGLDVASYAFDPVARERTRTELGIRPDQFVVGLVGRLIELKRFEVVVEALADLPERVVGLVVGAGPQQDALSQLAIRLGVEHRVRFVGEVADVSPMLSCMDLLASPCREETYGLALLEGLAAGLPVLYSSCPALDDVRRVEAARMEDERREVALDSTPSEFGAAIRRVLDTDPLPRQTPQIMRRLGIAAAASMVDDNYEELLDAAGRRHGQRTRGGPVLSALGRRSH